MSNKKVAVDEVVVPSEPVSTVVPVAETIEKEVPVKLSKEELKKKIRRGALQFEGRQYIDPAKKTAGKVMRVVSLKPGRKEYLESIGYVHRPDVTIGGQTLSQPNGIGGVFEQGINISSPSIVMEIDQDLYDARQEIKAEDNEAIFKQSSDQKLK